MDVTGTAHQAPIPLTHGRSEWLQPQYIAEKLLSTDSRVRVWLLNHGRPLRAAGEALRLAAVITPAADTEVRAEGAAVLLALLGIYRDCVPKPAEAQSDSATRSVVCCLEVLRACELLFEMRAKRAQQPRKGWSTITALEAAKLALRLYLLWKRGGQPLTVEDESLPPAEEPPECTCGLRNIPGSEKVMMTRGTRSGRKILHLDPAYLPDNSSSLSPPSASFLDPLFLTAYERRAAWLMRMLSPTGRCPACDSADLPAILSRHTSESSPGHRLSPAIAPRPQHVIAEVLYLVRPLIHLFLIRRYGWRSWRAWWGSFFVDLSSRALMAQPADNDNFLDEKQRRLLQLLYYTVRSPFFDAVVRSAANHADRCLRRVPVVGPATRSIFDLLRAMQRYWFYTSAS